MRPDDHNTLTHQSDDKNDASRDPPSHPRYMLESYTIRYFLLDGISDAEEVKMLENHRLRYIHSWIEEIRMVSIQCAIFDFLRINNLILTRYKAKIVITNPIKITLMVCNIFIFKH